MELHHYFHVFAGGDWRHIVHEHLEHLDSLATSGGIAFDEIRVGIVGPSDQRKRVARALPTGTTIVASCDYGYEQVTLDQLWTHAQPGETIAYSHTKGAANNHLLNRRWREFLEETTFSVQGVRSAVTLLDHDHDVVAPHWLTESVTGVLPEGCAGFSPGNYFWTTGAYVMSLPMPHDHQNRYAAEEWIGTGKPRAVALDHEPWDWRRWA